MQKPTITDFRVMTAEEDYKIVLHTLDRGPTAPSGSPYVIKLETFLRMAKLKYDLDFKKPFSKKGKTPWITYNGEEIADSQIIQEYLSEKHGINFSSHLTPEEKAVARGMRAILEDHFYYAFCLDQWVYNDVKHVLNYFAPLPIPKIFVPLVLNKWKRNMTRDCIGQGMGRHTQAEVERMGREDLQSVSIFLGEKPYMMGDKPTELDCLVFGMTVMSFYTAPPTCPYYKAVAEDFPNLKRHLDRIKEEYWPDWDDCLFNNSKQ